MLGQLIIGGWKSFWESVPLQTIDLSQDWHPCAVSVFTKPTYIDLSLYILLCCSGCQGTIHRFSLHNLHHWFINSRCSAHLILSPTIFHSKEEQASGSITAVVKLKVIRTKSWEKIQFNPVQASWNANTLFKCIQLHGYEPDVLFTLISEQFFVLTLWRSSTSIKLLAQTWGLLKD